MTTSFLQILQSSIADAILMTRGVSIFLITKLEIIVIALPCAELVEVVRHESILEHIVVVLLDRPRKGIPLPICLFLHSRWRKLTLAQGRDIHRLRAEAWIWPPESHAWRIWHLLLSSARSYFSVSRITAN